LIAENGKDAIEQLRRSNVDLLLSDIKMPDINGVDVLRPRRTSPRHRRVMMTAYRRRAPRSRRCRLGASTISPSRSAWTSSG